MIPAVVRTSVKPNRFLVACQAKVDLALDIAPFLGCAQPPHQFLEIGSDFLIGISAARVDPGRPSGGWRAASSSCSWRVT
jgi:hypothetical protein